MKPSPRPLAALLLVACAPGEADNVVDDAVAYTEERSPCLERSATRNLYFGDLHAHSWMSWDAAGYGLTITPEEAYGFARGEQVLLPPLGPDGKGTRPARLERPLDFAGLTDHSEFLGEVELCRDPSSAAWGTVGCVDYRRGGELAVAAWGVQLTDGEGGRRREDICGADGEACRARAEQAWTRLQAAAEAAYDRSTACGFTSLLAYEYTSSPRVTNQHRNVLFRNRHVPARPVTYFDAPNAVRLWRALADGCLDAGQGCDVMVLPHNSNWSNGTLFSLEYLAGLGEMPLGEIARLRARLEPVVEIQQHKGDMECSNHRGGDDPLCEFERERMPPFEDCGDGTGAGGVKDAGCVSRLDFVRGVLLEGMARERELGVNPYRLGVIGSTDTHNGTPGNTSEIDFPGHVGDADDTVEERMGDGNITHRGRVNNPGGLAAVWAKERSRDAIFDALARRETYSTSGTRIAVRLFGGWRFPDGMCGDAGRVSLGYRRGVPMGGVLAPRPDDVAAPIFLVEATQDPGTAAHPGTPLERAQIVKGWIGADGQMREKVFEVAVAEPGGASVDPATCATTGGGADRLCAAWRDPEFRPGEPAFYYARVVEVPTCRWSTRQCNALPADRRPPGCSDERLPKIIRERAVTSPIWHQP